MKRITTSVLATLLLTLTISVKAHSQSYESCGAKPGLISRLFSEAEKMRLKCIDDIYQENKRKTEEEVQLLRSELSNLEVELKKVAFKVDYNIVLCEARDRNIKRAKNLVDECHAIVKARGILIDRLRELTDWYEKPKKVSASPEDKGTLAPPCPSKQKLEEIKKVRYFNKKLYQTWERCVYQDPESMY